MADSLNATDVLDWEYLKEIAYPHDLEYSTDLDRALGIIAYQLIEAQDSASQNEILSSLILRATYGHSKEKNREVVSHLAVKLCTHPHLLMEFAKQAGALV